MAETEKTRLQRYIAYWQNHRFFSAVILFCLVVISIASFSDAVSRIVDVGNKIMGRSHSQVELSKTILRVKNHGPETISLAKLCELNLTEADGPIIQTYEKARVVLNPVSPGPDAFTFRGWEEKDYMVALPKTYVQSTLFARGSATIHFIVQEEDEFNNSIGIGSAPFMKEVLQNGLVEIGINLPQ